MQHSFADNFAGTSLSLFIWSGIMAVIACGGLVAVLGFERFADEGRKTTVRMLAGACLGSSVWAGYFLCLLALHPSAMAGFNIYLVMAAGIVAILGGAVALSRFGALEDARWRSAFCAAGVLTLSFALMHTLDIIAVDRAVHPVAFVPSAFLNPLCTLASLTVAISYLRWAKTLRARLAGGVFVFVVVLAFNIASALSIMFKSGGAVPTSVATGSLVLAFVVCAVAVGLLVWAFTYLLVDRSQAVVRLTADAMASKLADAALEGLIVHDGTTLLEANSRFSWIAGDGTESVRGQPLSDFFDGEALASIRQTMAEGGEGLFETTLLGANAEVEICTRLYDKSGGQFVTAVRDLSMRKRIDSAERANLAKSQFLANMSHELRTPLNAIIGYSEMIVEDSEDNGAIRDAGEIHIAAKNMLALVNDIVDLSRVEDGKIEFNFDLCDFSEMLDRLTRRFETIAQAQGLRLAFELDESSANVIIDEKRIEQCVTQLLSNAIKFTENGNVTVRFYAEGDDFKAMVRDTGIGINPARASQLFEAFSQGDGSIARRYGGVGVGLALTSRLVALMGGRLELETAEGKGSTFTLVAPSDPDPDVLAMRRKAGAHERVVKIINSERERAA